MMKLLIFVVIAFVMYNKRGLCQECNSRLVKATDSYCFLQEDGLGTVSASGLSVCAAICYRHRRCTAVSFNQSSGQCNMFSRYMIPNVTDTQNTGAEYFILESMCGKADTALPREYTRNDVIITSQVTCEETKIFLGISDKMFCVPPNTTWSLVTGTCVDKTVPFGLSGTFLQTVDSKLTIVGIPTGERFFITFFDDNNDYLMKTIVDMTLRIVKRNNKVGGVWQPTETTMSSSFPFVAGKIFTMDIISASSDFVCNVDGQLVFRFTHRLPRDSISRIKIFDAVTLVKILTQ